MKYNLSEIVEVIKDRRSIPPELFSTRKVQLEIVNNILQTAIWAPTHGNTQPWRFKVLQETALQRLSETLSTLYSNNTKAEDFSELKLDKLKNRPLKTSVIIAVCMERQASEKIPEIEEIEAVACAVQNMSLAATAYGIGAFWSTPAVCYLDEFKAFFNLGEKDKFLGLLYLGYPLNEWPKGQRKPIEYVTEWITA